MLKPQRDCWGWNLLCVGNLKEVFCVIHYANCYFAFIFPGVKEILPNNRTTYVWYVRSVLHLPNFNLYQAIKSLLVIYIGVSWEPLCTGETGAGRTGGDEGVALLKPAEVGVLTA